MTQSVKFHVNLEKLENKILLSFFQLHRRDIQGFRSHEKWKFDDEQSQKIVRCVTYC